MHAAAPIAPAERLRAAGLRVTATRLAVYAALGTHPHASADDVFDGIRAALPGTSLQSVYNALGDFVAAGLARRIEPAGRPGMFELRVEDNHHHVVCTVCGRVDDVDCVVGEAPCLHVPDAGGYDIRQAEVTFWGVCPACRAEGRDGLR
ncbi:Fur family transcriptional regulator [Microbacterium sp. 10M-3C3]|jgi:Fur family ferric uptake transcriptional regulator|uniref:Fur family transcriptional regulator n=1 Tax=Microbacterium sp. 10M-3C3 TaxID=2483401 RepID=UPI000F63C3EE|nr:Fur family transcriptional regulator [Microbacterium sp. 10M-3C3]